jgi:tRNA threonylcarbamoyladenosine biosynthesis protein TsaB
MKTHPILAFDCCVRGGSVALAANGVIETRALASTQQAATLVPAIAEVMQAQGVAFADLAAIVTTLGPGSFTGVRIGLATLHGLVAAQAVPVKLLTSLEALAWAAWLSGARGAAQPFSIPAGKGERYAQSFTLADAAPLAESAITLIPESAALAATESLPDARVLCEIAQHLPERPLSDAAPLYIRPPDAVVPAPLPWLAGTAQG